MSSNRITLAFIFSPLILALILAIENIIANDLPLVSLFAGLFLYSLVTYIFTIILALPSYLLAKKISNGNKISYMTTASAGIILGLIAGILLMPGFEHLSPSILIFGCFGFALSNIFWFIGLK